MNFPLTDWFAVECEPPVHDGVYELGDFSNPITTAIKPFGYARRVDALWSEPRDSIEQAAQAPVSPSPQPYGMFWRGLAVDPQ